MKNKILAILDRMIEDSEDIVEFIRPVTASENLVGDRMRKKALSQSILNLGENTKLLEKWLDLTLTTIDWRGLKGMREIAAHRYHTLDSEIIFDVAVNHVPQILEYLRQQRLGQLEMDRLPGIFPFAPPSVSGAWIGQLTIDECWKWDGTAWIRNK